MNYPIPTSTEEILALKNNSINEEIVATAIAGVIQIARRQGQSLEDISRGILQDDRVLDLEHRRWLSQMMVQAWNILPAHKDNIL